MAYETEKIALQEWIFVRWKGELIRTTVGRVIFNLAFPRTVEPRVRQPDHRQGFAEEDDHRLLS